MDCSISFVILSQIAGKKSNGSFFAKYFRNLFKEWNDWSPWNGFIENSHSSNIIAAGLSQTASSSMIFSCLTLCSNLATFENIPKDPYPITIGKLFQRNLILEHQNK